MIRLGERHDTSEDAIHASLSDLAPLGKARNGNDAALTRLNVDSLIGSKLP